MRLKAGLFLVSMLAVAIPSHAYRISTWIPSWDEKGLASVQQNAGKIHESNPGWYTITEAGEIAKNWNAEDPRLRAAASGTQLIPTIKNYVNDRFDGKLVARIVADATLRENHAEALTQLVVQNAFDGIDIDYESLPLSARADFSSFIQILASKLHSARKSLSVTVHAKTSDQGAWSAAAAQDWQAIGAVADSVKIMAYDYHWSTSPAGPITPLSWLDGVAAYAESVIPSNKIMMGLPWYGYDWEGALGNTVVYSQAMDIAARNGARIEHDSNGEATFTYNNRVVFFQDATSYARKVAMLKERHPGIGGFAHWRAGAEDPAIWNVIAGVSGGGSTNPVTPAPVPAYFTMSGPAYLQVRAGQQTSASYSLVPVNGFDGEAAVSFERIGGLDAGITLSSPTVRASAPVTISIAPSAAANPGQYGLLVKMTKDNLVAEHLVTIAVGAPEVVGSFQLAMPATVTVNRGFSADVAIRLEAIGGYTGTAGIYVDAIDAFPGTATLIGATASATEAAVLRIIPTAHGTGGTYRLRVRAVNGPLSHESTLTVTVATPRHRAVTR